MSDEPSSSPGDAAEEPFLERWARMKARANAESQAATPPAVQPPPAPEAATDSPVLPLPDLDLLDGESDYSAFLQPGVDLLLRRRALRKLFHSPKFNVLDGLDDYMGDFTNFEKLGDLVTADMRHQLERAARAAVDALEREPAPAPEPSVAAARLEGDGAVEPPADTEGNDDGSMPAA
jgi:hypothetical protein